MRGMNMGSEIIMYQTDDGLTKIETTLTVMFGYLLTKWQNYFSVISLQSLVI